MNVTNALFTLESNRRPKREQRRRYVFSCGQDYCLGVYECI